MWIVELYPQGDDQDADFYGPFPDEESATKFLKESDVATDREGETALVMPPPVLTTSRKKA